eukprot:12055004-Alexandrium_andersonii.AAC.1
MGQSGPLRCSGFAKVGAPAPQCKIRAPEALRLVRQLRRPALKLGGLEGSDTCRFRASERAGWPVGRAGAGASWGW